MAEVKLDGMTGSVTVVRSIGPPEELSSLTPDLSGVGMQNPIPLRGGCVEARISIPSVLVGDTFYTFV